MAWCGYFGAGKVFPFMLLTLFGVDGESPQLPRPAPGHDIGDTADAVRTLITGSAISFFICWQLSTSRWPSCRILDLHRGWLGKL